MTTKFHEPEKSSTIDRMIDLALRYKKKKSTSHKNPKLVDAPQTPNLKNSYRFT